MFIISENKQVTQELQVTAKNPFKINDLHKKSATYLHK
jgi:hypothetical protein